MDEPTKITDTVPGVSTTVAQAARAVRQLTKQKEELEYEVQRLGQIAYAVNARTEQVEANQRTVDAIALFIRENYQGEIAAGEHEGLLLQQVVVRYMGKERNRVSRTLVRVIRWLARLGGGLR